jgi:hypothetical protein
MAQVALPDGNSGTTNWSQQTGDGDGDWWDELDEGVSGHDGNSSAWSSPAEPINEAIAVTLQNVTDPGVHTGHTIRAVWRKNSTGGSTLSGKLELLQSTTVIATSTDTDVAENTYQTYSYTLSEAEAANITDYTALILRVTANREVDSTGRALLLTAIEFECPDASGGTQYDQSVSGSLTSAGTVSRATSKATAGALSSAGALARQAGKSLAGSLSSAGDMVRQTAKSLGGELSSAGALTHVRTFLVAVGGTLTSAGALLKSAGKSVAGSLSSSGGVSRTAEKSLSGSLTSAGELARSTAKSLVGVLTSSGALTQVRTFLVAIAGTLTSAGALTRQTGKATAGTLTSSGDLSRLTSRAFTGVLTSSGSLARTIGKALSGVLSSAGAVATALTQGGAITGIVHLTARARAFALSVKERVFDLTARDRD